MKQLLDFPRAQRLEAYKIAGDTLLRQQGGFSCCALNDALCAEFRGADVCPQFWCGVFIRKAAEGHRAEDAVVSSYDARLNKAKRMPMCLERSVLYDAICRDALQTRLMMLAWAHALDEAGDLEDILS